MTTSTGTHSTVNLSSIVLTIRTELVFTVRENGAEMMYVIEDDARSEYFRIGAAEYTFVSFLNGKNTFADAFGRTASILGKDALKEDEAASFCRWLVETGLAHTLESSSGARLSKQAAKRKRAFSVSQLNPMFIRFPLFCPDRLAKFGAGMFGWIFSLPAFVVWLISVGTAVFLLLSRWDEIDRLAQNVVSADNWLWLLVSWTGLKVLHESAHAIACRRYGGSVREGGILMLLLAPVPYVDVTSAWRFAARWPRIVTDAAGMYVELFVFAAAAWFWADCEPGFTREMLFNIMLTSSVMTIAVNANPLMRFDGYFVLCDALDLPNLSGQGRTWLLGIAKRIFFGVRPPANSWPETRTWIIALYGTLAFFWRLTVSFGMIMAADAMFFGAGVVVAAFATFLWAGLPLIRLVALFVSRNVTWGQRIRFLLLTIACGLGLIVISSMPWHAKTEAPIVVDYYPTVPIRASSAGFVRRVYVTCGQHVTEGTPIAYLVNPSQELERQSLQRQLEQVLARIQILRDERSLASLDAEVARATALQKRVDQMIDQGAELTLLAPTDGIVLTPDTTSLTGQYLHPGSEFCRIGADDSKSVLAMVSQDAIQKFKSEGAEAASVQIDGDASELLPAIPGVAEPRGRTDLLHPAFAATNGGPLEVRLAQDFDGPGISELLTEPHFVMPIEIPVEKLNRLRPGQTGEVFFRSEIGSTGAVVRETVIEWWLARQRALRSQWL